MIPPGKRDLHLIRMTPDLVYDELIGMGCARKLTFSWGGNPGVGSLHRLRDAVEHSGRGGSNSTNTATPAWRRRSARARRACRSACCAATSTTTWTQTNARIRRVECRSPANSSPRCLHSIPTSTILHAQRADRAGNVALARDRRRGAGSGDGGDETDRDRRRDRRCLAAGDERHRAPHWIVTAVVHCPGGAYPSYAQGFYARDNAFYQRWDAIARDRETFLAWMQAHVLGTADHAAFLASLDRQAA
jgi:glutaconate CoA-transferase subunit A